ncbi:MAG TPA: lysophospholipid acyltransferase family protein [Burkholderiales bacterium]|nr:lysophospholipid acyltransferase family protein [Burkholderiales bacterium]
MSSAAVVVRSSLFVLAQLLITPPYSIVALATFPLPPLTRYRIISGWSRTMIWLARAICGIRYRVLGAEHIPATPCILLAKHQSAWETLAFQAIFPPQVWVLKRELLRVPFFGWGLAMMSPIAIDRDAGPRALKQMLKQGCERLAAGFWIAIFPEGTRIAPGSRGEYRIGGAWLATRTGAPVLPVAHNAGECWGRNAFLKYPGLITVSIGAPIASANRRPEALNAEVEAWIEGEMQRIGTRHAAR